VRVCGGEVDAEAPVVIRFLETIDWAYESQVGFVLHSSVWLAWWWWWCVFPVLCLSRVHSLLLLLLLCRWAGPALPCLTRCFGCPAWGFHGACVRAPALLPQIPCLCHAHAAVLVAPLVPC
jgi:hypothetical protein